MTSLQRRKQNCLNAQNSTGPKTDEGKATSRQNALKHGLTAEVLALPNEDPAEIKRQRDAYIEAFDPQSHDEEALVEQLANSAVRLSRFVKTETEMIAEQVRNAEIRWDFDQKMRVIDLSRLLDTDPEKAVLELKTFAAGAEWLRAQLDKCVHFFNDDPDMIQRLLGNDPDTSYEEPNGTDVDREIAALSDVIDLLKPIAEASRRGAVVRASVLLDSTENRLFMRYLTTARNSFDSTFKWLTKLQTDREKLAVDEVKEADPRNEAALRGRGYAKRIYPGSYVIVNGIMYTAADVSDGNLLLVPIAPIFDPIRNGVSETSENVV